MNKNTKYMELYRKFKSLIRTAGYESVKAYEDSLSEDSKKQGKVRMCRVIRNYIEHEDQAFVEATPEMINFIQGEIYLIDEQELPVKKKMMKTFIAENDPIMVAAAFMEKHKLSIIPVMNDKGFVSSAISAMSIMKIIASGDYSKTKKVNAIQSKYKFSFINENDSIKSIRPYLNGTRIYLVLNDNKKIVGWLI